jgi:hypothetical protein
MVNLLPLRMRLYIRSKGSLLARFYWKLSNSKAEKA